MGKELIVAIRAKATDFIKGVADAEKKTRRFETAVNNAVKGAGLAFVALGATATVGIAKAISAASDLEETTSKFNTVFQGQEDIAASWSAALVDSYAMSTREARFYLSSVQDLLVPMGMQANAAGELSNEIVKLSADLGSFNNLPTSQVMEDIQSALVGNYETMKKYGVVLNATVVQEKALAMGLAETKAELTAGQKAQASYALMVEGSQAAIGDMARTSEGYANQLKKLQAQAEDVATTFGDALLPMATETLASINDWISKNQTNIEDWADAVGIMAESVRGFLLVGAEFVGWFGKVSGAIGLATTGAISWTEAIRNGVEWADKFAANPAMAQMEARAQAIKEQIAELKDVGSQTGSMWTQMGGTATAEMAKLQAELAIVQARIAAMAAMPVETTVLDGWHEKAMVIADDYDGLEEKARKMAQLLAEQAEAEISMAHSQQQAIANIYDSGWADTEDNYAAHLEVLLEQNSAFLDTNLETSNNFFQGMREGMADIAAEQMTWAEAGSNLINESFAATTKGIGDAAGSAIIYGTSMGKALKNVMKQVGASIISTLVEVGIQRLITQLFFQSATLGENVTRMSALSMQTFGGAYAAAVATPIIGPAIAPGIASASLAGMTAGATAASATGAGLGAAIPVAHGGLDFVPKEETYLLDKGERVLSPGQNEDLMGFMDKGGGGIVININALDTQSMEEAVRDRVIPILEGAMETNYGDYRDSIIAAAND